MSFDIKAHLQDHAYHFKQFKEIKKDDIHFNFSFEDIQFFEKDKSPEELLSELLQELKKPAEYKEKNGFKTLKNGEKKQKYTTRTINLSQDVKIEAIHVIGASGEHTHPHIHLILRSNGRYGKDFSLLRKHISTIAEKHGLMPNFDEIQDNKYKNLARSVKRFFWLLKKLPNKDFKEYFFKEDKKELLAVMIDKLIQYTKSTGNTLFYFKTMQNLRKRLQDNKIDYKYKKYNLREIIPIEEVLTQEDYEVIELLNNKKFAQKDIKDYIKNPILRDFARYSYYKDLKKSYIIKTLKETTLIPNLQPNKRFLNNFLKMYDKKLNTSKRKSRLTKEDNLALFFKNKLLKSAEKSANEKELRENLLKDFNIQLKLKKRKGKVIGYTFIKDEQEHYFKQNEIIEISKLREILKTNAQNNNIQTDNRIQYKKEIKQNELERALLRTSVLKRETKRTKQTITGANDTIGKLKQATNKTEERINITKSTITRTKQFIERTKQTITRTKQAITGRIREFGEKVTRIGNRLLQAFRKVSSMNQKKSKGMSR
jgi:hypothetical protein